LTTRFSFIFFAALLTTTLVSQEPEPFRGQDEIEGRDFDYSSESFNHRFSFRLRPEIQKEWLADKQGFIGTVGSVRSDELYVFMETQKHVELDEPFYFDFRFKRDEDFDGQFDRSLIGLGTQLSQDWSLSAFGDLETDKENVDLHFELSKKHKNNTFRMALIAVDFLFNDKQDHSKYLNQPFTYFVEHSWRESENSRSYSFFNYNSHFTLDQKSQNYDFSYEQYRGGGEFDFPISPQHTLSVGAQGEYGSRKRHGYPTPGLKDRSFSRRQFDVKLQLDYEDSDEISYWSGFYFFKLNERDDRPLDPSSDNMIKRRENMVYSGVSWQVNDKLLFWPGIYISSINNKERFSHKTSLDNHDNKFVSKLTLPLEFDIGENAFFTLNPTVSLHRLAFGGMNAQMKITF